MKEKNSIWLKIHSYDELLENEKQIIKKINKMRNGGYLFMIHPFKLLEDIGVKLSDEAKNEIIEIEPSLTGLSLIPYNALKKSKTKQNIHFNIKGLIKKGDKNEFNG